jgi:hypothetical protein
MTILLDGMHATDSMRELEYFRSATIACLGFIKILVDLRKIFEITLRKIEYSMFERYFFHTKVYPINVEGVLYHLTKIFLRFVTSTSNR